MKLIVILCGLITILAAASTSNDDAQATVDFYKNTNDLIGNYEYSFRTSNGIDRSETGELVNAGQPNEHIVVRGMYSYKDDAGNLVEVNYVADENGFQIIEPLIEESFAVPPQVVATLLG